jgi:hypothetical protein
MKREAFSFVAAALAASAQMASSPAALAGPHDALIAKHAAANGLPEQLVHRVIRIESRGNAAAVHRGNFGLMQIRLGTARGLGYAGTAKGLLDPDTNLTYAVKYLGGAYRAAGCDADRAISYYKRGYHGAAQRECGEVSQVAQAEAKSKREAASVKTKPDAVAANAVDVIKPKVVRTEIIATPKSVQAPARPVGNFEPARVAPPPAQPVAASNPVPAKQEPARKTDLPADAPKPLVSEPAARVELASVPLPPVRPALDATPKQTVQPIPRLERPHKRADKKPKAVVQSRTESKSKADDPGGVVSFLKKLVTPDKKSRKLAAEADADPPSQMQAPQ